MKPKDRIDRAIRTLAELWDELEMFTLDTSLADQSEVCQGHADLAAHAVANALEHMEHTRDYYRSVPEWAEDTAVLTG